MQNALSSPNAAGLVHNTVMGMLGLPHASEPAPPVLAELIERHRILVVDNEALYDANGKMKNKQAARAHDRLCDDALVAVMEAPCRSAADVMAKVAHLLDATLRERGPIYLDLLADLDLIGCQGDDEQSLFAGFMRSLAPAARAA